MTDIAGIQRTRSGYERAEVLRTLDVLVHRLFREEDAKVAITWETAGGGGNWPKAPSLFWDGANVNLT